MTGETLHDALNLLSADLITAADARRSAPRPKAVVRWKRWAAMAACFVLVLGIGLTVGQILQPEKQAAEAASQAPAAAAPAQDEMPAMEEAQEESAAETPDSQTAREEPAAQNAAGSGGDILVILPDGAEGSLRGEDAAAVWEILASLAWDPERICRCMPEYTLHLADGEPVGIHLTESYARCSLGQAELTPQQKEALEKLLRKAAEPEE